MAMIEARLAPSCLASGKGDVATASDGALYARFEGAHRVAYWIACLQRGPTGDFRHELFALRRRALDERDRIGEELNRRRAETGAFAAELSDRAHGEWKPSP